MADTAKVLEHHWCDAPADEWAKEYFKRVTGGGSFLARLQLLAHLHFYGALPAGYVGFMPSSAEVTRAGEQGENVELRVNWLRAHANAKHQIITAPRLTWGTSPLNTDSRSLADASRGAQILEGEWKQGPWEREAVSAQLGGTMYGEEFLFPYWVSTGGKALQYIEAQPEQPAQPAVPAQPPSEEFPDGVPEQPAVDAQPAQPSRVIYEGDLKCHRVSSWNAFCDPTATGWDASPWKAARVLEDRFDLIARFPEKREDILKASAAPAVSTLGPDNNPLQVYDPAKVLCHYFFHERTPGLPRGLQCVALSAECVLAFEPLEACYAVPPIHQFRGGELKGSPRGYTDFWEVMAAQDLATNVQSSLATNIVAFAKQFIWTDDDDLSPDQIGQGPRVAYGKANSKPPVAVELHQHDEGAFKHLETMKGDQRLVLGLNDVSMGEAPTGTPNAQAWALLATASVTANSGGQRDFVSAVRKVGQSILAIWKEKASAKRKTAVVGVHGAAVPRQEEWDKGDFASLSDVTCEIANPLQQTAAGRLQLEELYAKRGFVQTPEQLAMLVETGTLQPLTQSLRDELIYIASENEQLLKGECPPVMITDSDQMHIREHRGPTFSAAARANPSIIAAANKHIQMHVESALSKTPELLQLLGQSAPVPPALPGDAGSDAPDTLEQPGVAGPAPEGVKLPTAPRNPATGAPAGAPGMPV